MIHGSAPHAYPDGEAVIDDGHCTIFTSRQAMHFGDDGRIGQGWMRETLAGGTGALTVLPVLLTLGVLAFAPLGSTATPVALSAAFATASIGGLVHALLSRTSLSPPSVSGV